MKRVDQVAGTPATAGTSALLDKLNVSKDSIQKLRYRGYGWPGMFSTQKPDQQQMEEHITYRDTWKFLQHYRAYSTHLRPDGSGEEADISCGDPWYKEKKTDTRGFSLIVVRAEKRSSHFAERGSLRHHTRRARKRGDAYAVSRLLGQETQHGLGQNARIQAIRLAHAETQRLQSLPQLEEVVIEGQAALGSRNHATDHLTKTISKAESELNRRQPH